MTPEEMRASIEDAPLPGDGPPPYDRPELQISIQDAAESGVENAYGLVARSLAHAFLVLCEEDPSLLEVPTEDPTGFEAADNRKLWEAFEQRWPEGDDWLGGPTGFQFGWAHNNVRYVLGLPQVGNPAVMSIQIPD